jgi:hypothetical protein
MELESELEAAMRGRPEVSALAWVDGRTGLLLGLLLREGESTILSGDGVQALARVPTHPEIVVVGMAPLGTNVAVLRDWLGEVALRVGRAA